MRFPIVAHNHKIMNSSLAPSSAPSGPVPYVYLPQNTDTRSILYVGYIIALVYFMYSIHEECFFFICTHRNVPTNQRTAKFLRIAALGLGFTFAIAHILTAAAPLMSLASCHEANRLFDVTFVSANLLLVFAIVASWRGWEETKELRTKWYWGVIHFTCIVVFVVGCQSASGSIVTNWVGTRGSPETFCGGKRPWMWHMYIIGALGLLELELRVCYMISKRQFCLGPYSIIPKFPIFSDVMFTCVCLIFGLILRFSYLDPTTEASYKLRAAVDVAQLVLGHALVRLFEYDDGNMRIFTCWVREPVEVTRVRGERLRAASSTSAFSSVSLYN